MNNAIAAAWDADQAPWSQIQLDTAAVVDVDVKTNGGVAPYQRIQINGTFSQSYTWTREPLIVPAVFDPTLVTPNYFSIYTGKNLTGSNAAPPVFRSLACQLLGNPSGPPPDVSLATTTGTMSVAWSKTPSSGPGAVSGTQVADGEGIISLLQVFATLRWSYSLALAPIDQWADPANGIWQSDWTGFGVAHAYAGPPIAIDITNMKTVGGSVNNGEALQTITIATPGSPYSVATWNVGGTLQVTCS